jgi:hypothetical protein
VLHHKDRLLVSPLSLSLKCAIYRKKSFFKFNPDPPFLKVELMAGLFKIIGGPSKRERERKTFSVTFESSLCRKNLYHGNLGDFLL